jgi:hypothetical protein
VRRFNCHSKGSAHNPHADAFVFLSEHFLYQQHGRQRQLAATSTRHKITLSCAHQYTPAIPVLCWNGQTVKNRRAFAVTYPWVSVSMLRLPEIQSCAFLRRAVVRSAPFGATHRIIDTVTWRTSGVTALNN